jgi:hypothetical protein
VQRREADKMGFFSRKVKEEIETFEDVRKFLNSIEDINCGGCGVSALSMYRWLKKHNQLDDTKIVLMYDSCEKQEYLNNKKVLRQKDGVPIAPSHCCICQDGEFVDSTDKLKIAEYKWFQIINEEDFLRKVIVEGQYWNSMFDRKNIKIIEDKLEIDLSDIKINTKEGETQ